MLFVYWLEEHPNFAPKVGGILQKMEERGDVLCTSSFTLGEILAGMYKRGATETAARTRAAFQPPFVQLLPFDAEVADQYGQIRARIGVSPADAIHLACAARARVDLFLTNDGALTRKFVPGIQFIAGLDSGIL
jgi:predicted nucleic acid-binding protein